MTTVLIDHQTYELESLPEAVRDELVSLNFVENELHRLEMMKASLLNARAVYAGALHQALAEMPPPR
jgi:Family of unknown function (DUF6447)